MQFEHRGVLPQLGLLPSYQLVGLAAFLLQLHDFTVSLNHTFSQLGAQCSASAGSRRRQVEFRRHRSLTL